MPRITLTTNVKLNNQQKDAVTVGLQKVVDTIPHESGAFLMSDILDDWDLRFGDDWHQPCAAIEFIILDEVYDRISQKEREDVLYYATAVVSRVCGIPKDRIFAFYRNSPLWASGGVNIRTTFLKF